MNKTVLRVILLIGLLAAVMPQAWAYSGRQRSQVIGGRRFMDMRDLAESYRFRLRQAGKSFQLTGRRQASFERNRREMYLDRIRVVMSYGAQLRNNVPLISLVDINHTLAPLLRASATRAHDVRTVVLDPGHGGQDTGCRAFGLEEKKLTLSIAFKVRAMLRRAGYRVVMTRGNDRFLSLQDRPAVATRNNADIFVSIHVNAAGNASVSGVETFAFTPVGAVSAHSSVAETREDPASQAAPNSFLLAYRLQSSLIRRGVGEDRGLKRARFMVLRLAKCPAALVEVGFLSHAREGRRLASPEQQDKIARAIVDGILSYHRDVTRRR